MMHLHFCLIVFASKFIFATAIVNGGSAQKDQFPYQVFVTNRITTTRMYPFASGSLITTRHVLTAASIVVKTLKILAGQTDLRLRPGSIVRDVVNVTKYDPPRSSFYDEDKEVPKYHDIAILTMNEEVPINTYIKPIALGLGELKPGTSCTVSGWGYQEEDDITSSPLDILYAKVQVSQCTNSHWKFLKEEKIEADKNAIFCAGNYFGNTTGTCTGDAGGPLAYNGALVGIASWIHRCGNFYIPGLYTKVAFYTEWIKANAGEEVQIVNIAGK